MARSSVLDPAWITAVLEWRWTWVFARLALVGAYLIGGVSKAMDFSGAVVEQEHFGLHPGWLWAALAIVVELGGSALVIFGRLVWLGAGALGVLTAIATYVASPFWLREGSSRVMAMNTFFEHVGLIAGFVLAAILAAHRPQHS